jgi:ADP-heptose:LPS heptosyltransferase
VKGAYPILNRKSIALVIGAGTERKQWPYFQSVVKYYSDKGYDIFLVGGKQDKIPGDQLAASAPNVKNLCGQLSWVETGSVLQQCELVISNDTGPLHLAYSLDKPVIGIYAAHNYTNQWYPPATEKTAVLRNNEVPCIICYKKACRNNICMQGIEDKKVIAEADRLLRANSIA